MTEKRLRLSRWYWDPQTNRLIKTKIDYYDEGTMADIELALDIEDANIPSLVQALEDAGLLIPRIDYRVRTDDVKTINRLIDVLRQVMPRGATPETSSDSSNSDVSDIRVPLVPPNMPF